MPPPFYPRYMPILNAIAQPTTGVHHGLPQALRRVTTIVVWCRKGIHFAGQHGGATLFHHYRTNAMDAGHTVEVI